MTNKLIKDIDDETWRRFVAYCKLKNAKVHKELECILKGHLEKNLPNLFKKQK